DQLDDLIALQLGPVRHTMSAPAPGTLAAAAAGGTPDWVLTVHLTAFVYRGDADPSHLAGSPRSTAIWSRTSAATSSWSPTSWRHSPGAATACS
ncbi:MAG TPA: hypothetical protein VGD43_06150, partial [Micromonospora sp.]